MEEGPIHTSVEDARGRKAAVAHDGLGVRPLQQVRLRACCHVDGCR